MVMTKLILQVVRGILYKNFLNLNVIPPPITDLTAWWATSEPAPKAIPYTNVEPNPENSPGFDAVF